MPVRMGTAGWSTAVIAALMITAPRPAVAGCLICSCSVATGGITFGSYAPLSGSAVSATSSVAVSCQLLNLLGVTLISVPFTVGFSAGQSGSFTTRRMTGTASPMLYNLYTDPGYSTVLGDGSGSTQTLVGTVSLTQALSSAGQTLYLYGRIPANQTVRAGSYGDQLMMTVNF